MHSASVSAPGRRLHHRLDGKHGEQALKLVGFHVRVLSPLA